MAITAAAGGGNWSAGGTWVGGVAPTASDDVLLASTSGSVTVDTTTCIAKSVDCTGYTGTLTFTAAQVLTVSGSFKMVAGMTVSGTGKLTINATATLTSAGKTFPGDLRITTGTTTLADVWTLTGSLLLSFTGSAVINGNSINVNTNLTLETNNISGSTIINMTGTGTISCAVLSVNNRFSSGNIIINTSGVITFGAIVNFQGNFRYTAGTIDSTTNSSQFNIMGNTVFQGTGFSFYKLIIISTGASGTQTIQFVSGQTYTVTNALKIPAPIDGQTITLFSVTPSSPLFLKFTGNKNNCRVSEAIFTDIDATGTTNGFIANLNGGTLTRCTNIVNMVMADQYTGYNPVGQHYSYAGNPEQITFRPQTP